MANEHDHHQARRFFGTFDTLLRMRGVRLTL